jgi:hypothetical protein
MYLAIASPVTGGGLPSFRKEESGCPHSAYECQHPLDGGVCRVGVQINSTPQACLYREACILGGKKLYRSLSLGEFDEGRLRLLKKRKEESRQYPFSSF